MVKNILNNKILELNLDVDKNLVVYDQYIKYFLELNKDSRLRLSLECYPNLLGLYRELYKLKLETTILYYLLYDLESKENDLDLLKEINSLIYEKEFPLKKKLKKLVNCIKDLNESFVLQLEGYKDLDMVKIFFLKLRFCYYKFNLIIENNAYWDMIYFKDRYKNLYNQTLTETESNSLVRQDFQAPLIIDLDRDSFSEDLIQKIADGWTKT